MHREVQNKEKQNQVYVRRRYGSSKVANEKGGQWLSYDCKQCRRKSAPGVAHRLSQLGSTAHHFGRMGKKKGGGDTCLKQPAKVWEKQKQSGRLNKTARKGKPKEKKEGKQKKWNYVATGACMSIHKIASWFNGWGWTHLQTTFVARPQPRQAEKMLLLNDPCRWEK